MYRLILTKPARKDLDRLEGEPWKRVMAAINALRHNPRPRGCKKLKGSSSWRIRVGNYRILYDIDDEARIVTILSVQDRKDAYRG